MSAKASASPSNGSPLGHLLPHGPSLVTINFPRYYHILLLRHIAVTRPDIGISYGNQSPATAPSTSYFLDEEPCHTAVLVVPVSESDLAAPLQGVVRLEGPAEDPVRGGAEGDWEVDGPVEG